MNTLCTYTKDEILHLETEILAEALTLFQNLISWVDNDIFTDAPERARSVARAEATTQLAHQVMEKIKKALADGEVVRSRPQRRLPPMAMNAHPEQYSDNRTIRECLANRILDEADEAFGVRNMARERAACGGWDPPETISNCLFWIDDEAALQEELGEDPVYARALRGVAVEIRALGFEPSPAP